MNDEEFDRIIRKIAEMDLVYEAMREAGTVSEADYKSYQANRGELIERLDEACGTTDVSYEVFRDALDEGAPCDVLVELKNGIDPHDPLRNDAVKDLRSVGCYSKRSKRRGR